jgi:hypothetical protein
MKINKKAASTEDIIKIILWAILFAFILFGVYTLLKKFSIV